MCGKALLRRETIARRNAMAPAERAAKSERIADAVLRLLDRRLGGAHGGSPSPVVAAFWPFGSEVDTRPLIRSVFDRGWRLALPCMVRPSRPSAGEARSHVRAAMRFLQVGAGLLDEAALRFAARPAVPHEADEPWMTGFPVVDIRDIDAFVVPLVAFDDAGNRLGYGGGNYDRALPLASPDATVVGVAFEEQRAASVPTERHDVPIPVISA